MEKSEEKIGHSKERSEEFTDAPSDLPNYDQLVEEAIRGSDSAFTLLWRHFQPRMVRYLAEWRGRFYRVQVAPLRDATGVVNGTVAVALETAAWPQGAPSTAGAAATPRRSDGPVVLVVDDDVSVLNLVDRVLRDLGCRTLLAPDPELALRLVRESLPTLACLVVDITMPRIDGPTLVERLRAGRADLPVVYITGVPDAAPSGAAVVVKPFTPDTLARAVSACLDAPVSTRTAGG